MSQHLLYEPNAPNYRQASQQSLFDKLAPDPSLSTFMDVLMQVDDIFRLVNHSTSDGNSSRNPPFITMFVPTNTAFRHGAAYLNELLLKTASSTDDNSDADTDDLQRTRNLEAFLKYHIVPYDISDIKKHHQRTHTLLNDKDIDIHYHLWSGRLTLNDHANVVNVEDPLRASNGVAYKIDQLLKQP